MLFRSKINKNPLKIWRKDSSVMQEAVIITEQWQFPRILGKSFLLPVENSETMKYYLCKVQPSHLFDLLSN